MEYIGILKLKGGTVQVSEKFKKRDFVVTSEEQYPQHISFQLKQDRTDIIDPINVGEKVKVVFGLNGREWEKPDTDEVKYFNTLVAFQVVKVGGDNF